MPRAEVILTGGRTTAGVVRVGNTVRRSPSANAPFVHAVLKHLEAHGFSGAPRYLGQDESGRDVHSFLPGVVPVELGEISEAQCMAAARLLRHLHDATLSCELRVDHEVICHGDPSPCNCVFIDSEPKAFIDFDAAHAGSRAEDLGYAAWLWLDIGNDEISPEDQGRRLHDFVSAYDSATSWDGPHIVMQAQRRLSTRPDGPPGNRDWAQGCLSWTEENLGRINTAFDMRSNKSP